MITVFNLQWLRLKREPALAITFLIMTLVFVFFIVGTGGEEVLTIASFSDDLSDEQVEEWIDRLDETDAFKFVVEDRETVEEGIQTSKISFALELGKDNYQFLVGQDSQYIMAVNQHVERVYRTHLRLEEVND